MCSLHICHFRSKIFILEDPLPLKFKAIILGFTLAAKSTYALFTRDTLREVNAFSQ